jgi:hypothetical protein
MKKSFRVLLLLASAEVRASEPFHPSTNLCLPEDTARNDHPYEFSISKTANMLLVFKKTRK